MTIRAKGRYAKGAPVDTRQQLAMLVPERELQANVTKMALLLGWTCYHTWLSVKSVAGYPDLTAVHPSQRRVIWVEMKSQNGVVHANQQAWLDTLRAAGQEAMVWRPSDLLDGTVERCLTSPPATP